MGYVKTKTITLGLVSAVAVSAIWVIWEHGEPRRNSVRALERLETSLTSSKADALIADVVIPPALSQRTVSEQAEFLTKALRDEISPAGIAALRKEATFGPLREIFPGQADHWSQQSGIPVDDCLAFRMERHGIQAQVVIYRSGSDFRILRCVNVSRLAS